MKIEGWITDDECSLLYNIAKNCKGNIVEIGSWKGKSTVSMGKGSKQGNNVNIYAIDPHTGHEEQNLNEKWTFDIFKENIKKAKIDDIVIPIIKSSKDANKGWNKQIHFLFIDGCHQYKNVIQDFKLWSPFLVDGGIIALHDSTSCLNKGYIGWDGVMKVVKDEMIDSENFKGFGIVDTITFAKKTNMFTSKDALIKDRFRLKKSFTDMQHHIFKPMYFLMRKVRRRKI